MEPHVQQLIESLEVMVAVSEAQSASLAQSREEAQRMEEIFESRMFGSSAKDAPSSSSGIEGSLGRFSSIQGTLLLTRRREEAYLKAFDALMHLWSFEHFRTATETVFQKLREIRMIDIESDMEEFPADGLRELEGSENLSMDQRRQSIMEAMNAHHENMRNWMRRRQAEADVKIERSDRLLGEALEIARSMTD